MLVFKASVYEASLIYLRLLFMWMKTMTFSDDSLAKGRSTEAMGGHGLLVQLKNVCLQLKVLAEQKEKLFLPEKKIGTCFQTSSAQHVTDITTWCPWPPQRLLKPPLWVSPSLVHVRGWGAERRTHSLMACDMNSVFRSYHLDLE